MAWYRRKEIGLDRVFVDAVDDAIRRMRQKPGSYAKRRREYRALLLRRFPYVVYFRIVGDEIRVAAVLHQRRGHKARDRRLKAGQQTKP